VAAVLCGGRLLVRAARLDGLTETARSALVASGALIGVALAAGLLAWAVGRALGSRAPWAIALDGAAGMAFALASVPLPPTDFRSTGGTEIALLLALIAAPLSAVLAGAILVRLLAGPHWLAAAARASAAAAVDLAVVAIGAQGFGTEGLRWRAAVLAGLFALAAAAARRAPALRSLR
jgi:hypothetical protein